jgi:hypothetical protein
VSRELSVKAFSRPAAGQPPPLPSDVRPPHILVSTLNYLINNVVPQLPKSHPFLWDRTRSIRQDFTYQNYSGPEAIECNELIARVHLLCLHVMLTSDQEYSKQQELEQLNKALQTLSELYDSNRRQNPNFRSPREAEFRSYILLSHIKDPDIDRQTQLLPLDIFNSPEIQTAILLRGLLQQAHGVAAKDVKENCANLFSALFQLISTKNVSFLSACLIESHFQDIRFGALASMARAYHTKGKPYTLSRLTRLLGFQNEEDTASFCESYGLTVVQDDQQLAVNVAPKSLNPQKSFKSYFTSYIDSKMGNKSWAACIIENPSSASFASSSAGFQSKSAASKLKPFQSLPTSFSNQSQFSASANGQIMLEPPSLTSSVQPQATSFSFTSSESKPVTAVPAFSFNTNKNNNAFGAVSTAALPMSTFGVTGTNKPAASAFSFSSQKQAPSTAQIQSTVPASALLTPTSSLLSTGTPKLGTETSKPATTMPTAEPVAPAPPPIPKVVKKYVYFEADVKNEVNNLFRGVVSQMLKSQVLPKAWDTTKQVQAKIKEEQFNAAVAEEFNGMISALLVEAAKNVQAEKMNQTRLKRLAVRLVGRAAFIARARIEEKKQRENEFKLISSQLGKPRVAVSSMTAAATSSPSSRLVNRRLIETFTPEERYERKMESIRKQRQKEAEFWKPLDVRAAIANKLESGLRKSSNYGLAELRFSVFCRDWNTIVGKWIQAKLDLGHVVESSSKCTTVYLEQLQQDPATYQDMTQLVLVVGLDQAGQPDPSLEYDRKACAAILNMIKGQSRYKLDVLVLYWGSANKGEEAVRSALGIKQSGVEFGSVVFSAIANDADETNPSFLLEQAVADLVDKFEGRLSIKGAKERAKYQREQQEARAREEREAYQEQLRVNLEESDRRLVRIKAMNGLHVFEDRFDVGQAEMAASVTNTSGHFNIPAHKRQKTAGGIVVERKSPGKNSTLPKGVRELRELVAAVKRSRYLAPST